MLPAPAALSFEGVGGVTRLPHARCAFRLSGGNPFLKFSEGPSDAVFSKPDSLGKQARLFQTPDVHIAVGDELTPFLRRDNPIIVNIFMHCALIVITRGTMRAEF